MGKMLSFKLFILEEQYIEEKKGSGAIRYNSEIGLLIGMIGGSAENFDPNKPENYIPASRLANPKDTYNDIKKLLAPNYEEQTFSSWVELGKKYSKLIDQKVGLPKKFDWAGGKNIAETAADIVFVKSNYSGVSIKAEGGVTLANLTPKAIGIEPGKNEDIFYTLSQKEFLAFKQQVFSKVLELARKNPNKPISAKDPKYYVVYNKKNNTYLCAGKKNFEGTEEEILNKCKTNSPWQRAFGDWIVANWQQYGKLYSSALTKKLSSILEKKIEEELASSSKLANILRLSEKPYFYVTPKSIYLVPDKKKAENIEIKKVTFGEPEGATLKFYINVGVIGSEDSARIELHVRYANGMFESNPTVRVQDLKDPHYIEWEKLN